MFCTNKLTRLLPNLQDFDALDAVVATRSTQPVSSLQARDPSACLPQQQAQQTFQNHDTFLASSSWLNSNASDSNHSTAPQAHHSSKANMGVDRHRQSHAWPSHAPPTANSHGHAANHVSSRRLSPGVNRPCHAWQAPSQKQAAQDRHGRPASSRQTNIGPMLQKAAQVHQASQARWAALDNPDSYHPHATAASSAAAAPGPCTWTPSAVQPHVTGSHQWQPVAGASSAQDQPTCQEEYIDLTANDADGLLPSSRWPDGSAASGLAEGAAHQGWQAEAAPGHSSLHQPLRPAAGRPPGPDTAAARSFHANSSSPGTSGQEPAETGDVLVPCSTANFGMRLHRSVTMHWIVAH